MISLISIIKQNRKGREADMKMFLGDTPVKSLNIHHFEMDTNDATMFASDLQAGVTAYARGQKIVGTGKCFEFASYGSLRTNTPTPVPSNINTIQIGCVEYPVQTAITIADSHTVDFSTEKILGNIIINNVAHPISVTMSDNMLTVSCSNTIYLEIFYGKDNYV